MTLTDKFTIVASTVTTLAFIVYVLVEFPRLTTNIKGLNNIIKEQTIKFPKIIKFITLFSFFGSIFMTVLLICLFFDKNYQFDFIEWVVFALMIFELLFWSSRAKSVF